MHLRPLTGRLVPTQLDVLKLVDATASSLVVRLDRAGGVIRQITSILDNTLTASSLISSDSRLTPVEADLTALVELCLADLAPL